MKSTHCLLVGISAVSGLGLPLFAEDPTAPKQPGKLPEAWSLHDSIYPYEPTYFLLDPFRVDAKFQLSFSFRLIGKSRAIHGNSDRPSGFYMSYSQTSLWNIGEESAPFYDSSYRPEGWWHQDGLPVLAGMSGLDLQAGFGHESNGKGGDESRSLNKVFARPVARWDLGDDWQLRLRPRVFIYAGDMGDNPDMADYRGHVDVDGDIGQRRGWLLNSQIRVGRGWNRASVLAELSYPLNRITNDWVNAFGFVQFYDGWSEMLRSYDERTIRLSVGIAIAR